MLSRSIDLQARRGSARRQRRREGHAGSHAKARRSDSHRLERHRSPLVTVDRNRARIGITAPKHIAVDREEGRQKTHLDELIALDEAAAEENADEDDEAQP